ncbi:hypothetical protein [Chlorobium sp. KB01]|nr:hypothetical protein [Chlorobium sp. KB01]
MRVFAAPESPGSSDHAIFFTPDSGRIMNGSRGEEITETAL